MAILMPEKTREVKRSGNVGRPACPQSKHEPLDKEHRGDFGKLQEYVMVLYAKGLSNKEISAMLLKRHGAFLSKEAVGDMLERVMPGFIAWQGRWLLPMYEQVYILELAVRVKNGYCSKAKKACVLLGFRQDRYMEALGLWVTDNPDGLFWSGVLLELQARGLREIASIICEESGELLSEIKGIFPKARIVPDTAFAQSEGLGFVAATGKVEHNHDERQMGGARLPFVNSAGYLYAILQKATRSENPFPSDEAILKALFWRIMEWEASVILQFDKEEDMAAGSFAQ